MSGPLISWPWLQGQGTRLETRLQSNRTRPRGSPVENKGLFKVCQDITGSLHDATAQTLFSRGLDVNQLAAL